MGARKSKPLPNPDHYNPELPSPFDSLPLHVLANIFARITDVSSKIRLSCVCHRFHTCIQLEESWQFNTALKSQELKSPQSVLAFMKHVPRVKSLDLSLPLNSGWMSPEALEHAAKLRFTRFRVSSGVNGDPGLLVFLDQCVQYFSSTLTHLRFERLHSSSAVSVLINLMAKCSALEDVYIAEIPIEAEVVLRSLEGKPLRKLQVISRQPVEGGSMASLFNSVRGHTLHTLETPYFRFANPIEFCHQLQLSAAGALKKISLWLETTHNWTIFEFVRELPGLLPNVEEVSIICILRAIPSACFGCTKAFKHLLDSAQHRPHPISIKFNPQSRGIAAVSGAMMAGWFDALCADFCSCSDYDVQIHIGNPWKRTISKGQASVTLICYV